MGTVLHSFTVGVIRKEGSSEGFRVLVIRVAEVEGGVIYLDYTGGLVRARAV